MSELHDPKLNGKPNEAFPRVRRIIDLLGPETVLIPWPRGMKGAKWKWGHLTPDACRKRRHLTRLEGGNIGVGLGPISAHLCSIDWDSDERLASFIALNPRLAGTLRTRGARGGNVWIRLVGEYPASAKLKQAGAEVGEWRAEKNQTIVSGTHPSGVEYRFEVEARPVEVSFDDIVWPEGVITPKNREKSGELGSVHSNTVTHVTQSLSHPDTQLTHVVFSPPASSTSSLFDISPFIPSARGQSDDAIWSMARQLRSWERDNGRRATTEEIEGLFPPWWDGSEAHVDPVLGYVGYGDKWLRAAETAVVPLDESFLSFAFKRALSEPRPPEANRLFLGRPMPEKMQLLIAFLFQMQRITGKKAFHVGSRDIAPYLETPFTTIHSWLSRLCRPGSVNMLKEIRKGFRGKDGKAGRTTEYIFLPLVKPAEVDLETESSEA